MRMKQVVRSCLVTTTLALGVPANAALVGTAFTYQGQLKKDGQPVNDNCDLRFTLWSSAGGPVQIGPVVAIDNLPVSDGFVTAFLDFGDTAFQGEARWLQLTVDCPAGGGEFVTLAPRQELTPAPYAIGLSLPFVAVNDAIGSVITSTNTGMGRAGDFGISNAGNPEAAVNAVTVGSGPAGAFLNDSGGDALRATAIGSASAVYGTSPGTGVTGESNSGTGIRGVTNNGVGVVGESVFGTGVSGVHSVNTGAAPGVSGESKSTDALATGVLGRLNQGLAGSSSAGVRGINSGNGRNGAGVWGEHLSEGNGVYGTAPAALASGVYGESANGTGVQGVTDSPLNNAAGVKGRATAPVSTRGVKTIGVYGESQAVGGIGVYGLHPALSGTEPGVYGETRSSEEGAVGVLGRATATSSGVFSQTYGVYGESNAPSGVGVFGRGLYGVWGQTDDGHGIHASASDAGTAVYAGGFGSGRGIWAETFLGTGTAVTALAGSSYAVYADSDEGTAVYGTTGGNTAYGGNFSNTGGGVGLRASGVVAIRATGDVEIFGQASVEVLEITGADLAEKFAFSEPVEPGMVVAIDADHPGKLCISRKAYNHRVAGIVSGANRLDAGVILGNQPGSEEHRAVALSGRVWVHCDATQRAVEPGGFLTTADRAGYAMPVVDKAQAEGAIIGKAMTPLERGKTGFVLVLVNLQ